MQKHIPNTVTLLGAFCGMLATSFAFEQRLDWAAYCILIAAFCDFVDGFLARLLNAKSALGADLDSLADVVSFSVAPASIAYHLLLESLPVNLSWPNDLFRRTSRSRKCDALGGIGIFSTNALTMASLIGYFAFALGVACLCGGIFAFVG